MNQIWAKFHLAFVIEMLQSYIKGRLLKMLFFGHIYT